MCGSSRRRLGTREAVILYGPYELLERINVGGMAEIVKARALSLPGEPVVAVKRILPHLVEDAQFVTMFLDESRMLSGLHHPHVIRTLDVGTVDGGPYLALEFVHGKDARHLFHWSRSAGEPLPVPLACYVVARVLDGLDCAHQHRNAQGDLLGLVHRDVSLQNILLSYEGDVKITDFGIARSAGNESQTQAGVVKGKFGYMAPEQIRSQPLDLRSDIFAAGICLHELLTTERLFTGESDFAAIERVRNVSIQPPSQFNRDVPSALESIVMKALAKRPRDRFQTAGEMRDALLQFLSTCPGTFGAQELGSYLQRAFLQSSTHRPDPVDDTQVEPNPIAGFDASSELSEERTVVNPMLGAMGGEEPTEERTVVSPGLGMDDEESTVVSSVTGDYALLEQDRGGALDEEEPTVITTGQYMDPMHVPTAGAVATQAAVPAASASHGRGMQTQAPRDASPAAEPSVESPVPEPWDWRVPAVLSAFALALLLLIGWLTDISTDVGAIELTVLPADADVQVDGERLYGSDGVFVAGDLETDALHRVKVEKQGFQPWTAELHVGEGAVLKIPQIQLMPATPRP